MAKSIHYRTVWLSDIHLGFKDCRAEYLLDFLASVDCDTLYLVGDIVDLWSLKRRFYWPSSHYEVIRAIFKKARKGTRVVYIPGNHDFPIRDYVGHLLGPIEIMEEGVHETADGKRMLMFHGDILDGHIRLSKFAHLFGDALYDFLLFINRTTLMLRRFLGRDYWSLATYLKNRTRRVNEVIEVYERAAAKEAKERGFDGVICGHIHKPELRDIEGVRYCNDGDWIENCTALTETPEGELQIIKWTEKQMLLKRLGGKAGTRTTGLGAEVLPLRKAG